MLKEFQEFISKGNVMDLAVGVIIGAAFGKIVASLVDDVIMPIVGAIFGGLDFNNYFFALSPTVTATSLVEAKKQGAVLGYGSFFTVLINFLILAWIIFLMVKAVNTDAQEDRAREAGSTRSASARRCCAVDGNPRPSRQEIVAAWTMAQGFGLLYRGRSVVAVTSVEPRVGTEIVSAMRAEARNAPVSGIEAVATYGWGGRA